MMSSTIAEAEKSISIGDNTDLLGLLITLTPPNNMLKIIMPAKSNQLHKIHNIRTIQDEIGEMKDFLLTVYAFTGSRLKNKKQIAI